MAWKKALFITRGVSGRADDETACQINWLVNNWQDCPSLCFWVGRDCVLGTYPTTSKHKKTIKIIHNSRFLFAFPENKLYLPDGSVQFLPPTSPLLLSTKCNLYSESSFENVVPGLSQHSLIWSFIQRIFPSPRPFQTFHNNLIVLLWRIVSLTLNPQARGQLFVGCLWLFF
jgi:hypothetical protein